MARITVKVSVSGRVQGVSFRAIMRQKALDHHVDGWVRNKADGSVEALLQGDEPSVRRVVEWARLGPPRATVASLKQERIASHPVQVGFSILE